MTDDFSAAPWLTGVIFKGHFEVGHLIARGGMAEVYHAVDLWSDNPVALKVLLPHLSTDPAQQQKFFREGSALKKIQHENVVGVIDEGTELVHGQQVMFLVLEYVHGCTLAQLMQLRPVLSVGEMLDVMIPAVEGLSEVHAHHLIHRDIKPANILLEADTEGVKLSDFGLTRRADQSATGQLMGTPSFVAPEILDVASPVGPPADIFALGVMMYRMLTGRMPFAGADNDQQVLYHNMNTDIPSLTHLAEGISSDIAGVVSWCTRRNPRDRPQDATELYRALRDIEARASEQEKGYRLDQVDQPTTALWEDVADIAERSGRIHRGQAAITGFGAAEDLLDAGTSGPLSAHEQAVRSAADAPVEVYAPTDFAGVGPKTETQAVLDAQLSEHNAAQDPAVVEQLSISAEYNRQRATAHRSVRADAAPASAPKPAPVRPADPAQWTEAQRRTPAERWRPPLSPVSIVLILALVLLGFVAAGLVGWWLASLIL
ncbi:serine/threonine protein kinase [Rothia nasimurium]|uniref:serine/threonine protein kinase n=2 Tax=Rothia nasimurium TaxID=85336 RepID=UPI001F190048|nr:serine/threonine-protein kinase [Rothia nasimurium]